MPVRDISCDELENIIAENPNGVEIIDVREPFEHEIVRLKGSKLIPLGDLLEEIDQIDWSKEVALVCRSGSRSKLAAYQLSSLKNKDIFNLQGGLYESYRKENDLLEKVKDDNIITNYFR